MLHAITKDNRHLYTERLKEMHRLRYKVFVEEQGWDLSCQGEMEIDSYDLDDTVYFIYIDQDGDIQGSMRLLPTTRPYVLSELYPELCADEPPSGAHIYESSRGCVNRKLKDAGLIWSTILAGAYEYSLLSGIKQIAFIVDIRLFSSWIGKGIDISPLGPPCEINGDINVAALREVTAETVVEKQLDAGMKGPVLNFIRNVEHAF